VKNTPPTRGITAIELLIAAALAALVISIALPSYRNYVLGKHRTLAITTLTELRARQLTHHAAHGRYATGLQSLGYPADPGWLDRFGNLRRTETVDTIYRIELMVNPADGFRARALPVQDQQADVRCRALTVTADGRQQASGSDGPQCWPDTHTAG
jgi:type IV pilus assembly protein PilE